MDVRLRTLSHRSNDDVACLVLVDGAALASANGLGDLEAVVRYGCSREGDLAVINASRSILYASSGDDFAKAARMEALRLRDAMEKAKSLVKR